MRHQHELVGCDDAGALAPHDGFNFTDHGALSDDGGFQQMVDVPRDDVAAPHTAQTVVGTTHPLKHPVNGFWRMHLNDASHASHVDAQLQT